jgi:MFS family permease
MVAAWLLLVTDAVTVFTIIGLVSSLAFIFVLRLDEPTTRIIPARLPLRVQLAGALKTGGRTPAIWLSGSLQATAFIALYALKAFLPIYALSIGINVIVVGTFFSLQEAVHILLKPAGGRFGDRLGHLPAIALGMGLLSAGLSLLTNVGSGPDLLLVAAVMGAAQALIFPSATALVSRQVDPENLGAGMGFVGTMKNAGKVLGPIISGALIGWLDYGSTFHLLALALVLGSVVVLTYHTGAVMRQRVNA